MSLAKQPFISFIVPVFNVELYLEKCLLSILNQSLKNIEVIVVNDGSTDSSLDICYRLAKIYTKLRIFNKKNEGQGIARNFGLNEAHGKYVCYVDSDDSIDSHMAEELFVVLDKNKDNVDFINFGFNFIAADGHEIKKFDKFEIKELIGAEIFLDALIDKNIYSTSCNKLYRRSFLLKNNILFPPFRVNEDIFYSRAISFFATKSLFIPKVYYHALVRAGSTSRKMSTDMFRTSVNLIEYEKSFFATRLNHDPDLTYFHAHIVKLFSYMLIQSAFRISVYSDYKMCFDIASQVNYYEIGSYKSISSVLTRKGRIMIILCRYPFFLRVLANILKKMGLSSFVY
jgi:glycosyltransferase EpsH